VVEVKENESLEALMAASDSLVEEPVEHSATSLVPPDNLAVAQAAPRDTSIQVSDVLTFAPFFDALSALKSSSTENVRVLHFGDSQLEGDRITMQLRDAYQREYGGTGFGYVALEPLVAPSSLAFKNSEGFIRKTVFGRRDTAFKDMKYGHLGSFTLLAQKDSAMYQGSISFAKRNWGFSRARNFTTAKLHIDGLAPTKADIIVADTVFSTRIFPEGEWTLALDIPLVDEFNLRLSSSASSRIFGISFESPYGFHADNVAMRGASGMIFSKMNDEQFSACLEREGYDLIIMQFGGNAVPYLKDEAHAGRFARALGRQLGHIQRLYPKAAILFIGPSDMARKEGLEMKSYPLIASLKEQLRTEVMRRGAGYWDLYDVMGGEGSMVQWVEDEPALAVKDYIHFTPKGASKVGSALVEALKKLEKDYAEVQAEIAAEHQRLADSTATFNMSQGTGVQP
jgi:lysophospholipase L1-like esterase